MNGMQPLAGQVAFVTGGGGGIGRACALALAEWGADVAIFEVIPERAEEAAAAVEALGRRALPMVGTVMDTGQIADAVAQTAEHFGRLDIVINNAGGVARKPFTALAEKNWRRHIDFNLVSVLAATSAAVPVMEAGGRGGAIVNVTSIEGARAAPGYAVYAACKAGVNNLTRTLAVELSDAGIRVNAMAPDYTVTPGTRGQVTGPVDESAWPKPSAAQEEIIRRRIPLGRPGVDRECGQLAAFLCSPLASYITGAIIPVDGGTWGSGGWVRSAEGDWVLPPG